MLTVPAVKLPAICSVLLFCAVAPETVLVPVSVKPPGPARSKETVRPFGPVWKAPPKVVRAD